MGLDVGAALPALLLLTLLTPTTAAAEEPAEEIAEVAEVADVEVEAAAGLAAAACAVRTERVVLLALLRVLQHVVRRLDLLEARLRALVARVAIRVMLARELAVRLLDLFLRRRLRDAERFVERRHSAIVTRAGRSTWSPSR